MAGLMDDDDDMWLIQASQMVEAEIAAITESQERAEVAGDDDDAAAIDEATISMLVRDVEREDDDGGFRPPEKGPNFHRFNQTQCVFKGESSSSKRESEAEFLKPPPTRDFPKKPNEAEEKLSEENARLLKEQCAKNGEISMLRDELKKRRVELDEERSKKAEAVKAKDQEIRTNEKKHRAAVESVKSERDFLARELESAKESLKMINKRQVGESTQSSEAPAKRLKLDLSPPKKQLKSSLPKSIDVSLLEETAKKTDSSVQTFSRRRRRFVLAPETVPVASAVVAVSRSKSLESLPGNFRLMMTSSLSPDRCRSIIRSANVSEVNGLRVILDQFPDDFKLNDDDFSKFEPTFMSLIEMGKELEKKPETEHLIIDILGSIGSLVDRCTGSQRERVVGFLKDCLKGMSEEKEELEMFEKRKKTLVNPAKKSGNIAICIRFLTSFLTPLTSQTLANNLCQMSRDSCFLYHLYSAILNVTLADKRQVQCFELCRNYVKFVACHLPKNQEVRWLKKEGFCKYCKSDVIKAFACVLYLAVKQCSDLRGKPVDCEPFKILKNGVECLHKLWFLDPISFVSSLGEIPAVQRRYIWTSKQLCGVFRARLNLPPAKVGILTELAVECDLGKKI